jgi:hypothetical protein
LADETEVKTRFTASDEVSPVVKAIGGSVDNLNKGLGMLNKAGSLVGLGIGISSVAAIGSYAVGTINKAVSAYEGLEQQQLKLVTIMHQRMGASADVIASVNQQISAESRLGVVSGSVQRAGAQQVATFLNQASSINTLLPAMNDLAVQQHGYNVTAQDMTGIANLFGKAMMGQSTALKRVGITMDENQASLLKTLPEGERAALLAQIITQNVGNMNSAFAQTPEGQKTQAVQKLGAAWADLGSKIAGVKDTVEAEFATLQANTLNEFANALAIAFLVIANGVMYAVEAIAWFGNTTVQLIENLAPFLMILGSMYVTFRLVTFAIAAYRVATGAAAATTAALRAVESACLIVMGIKGTVVWAVTAAMNAYRSGTILATIAQRMLNITTLAFPGFWIAAVIAVIIGVVVALAASTGNLQDVFSSVWGSIVSIVTGAINTIIDAINVFIEAMNKAASLGNKLFHWDINPLDKVQHVSGYAAAAMGNKVIYGGLTDALKIPDISSQMPAIPAPAGVNTDDMNGTGSSESKDNQRAIKDDVGKIATDTGRISDKIDMTDQEIQELRDMADKGNAISWREQHINISVNNDNNISSQTDIDGMTSDIVDSLRNALAQNREGVAMT